MTKQDAPAGRAGMPEKPGAPAGPAGTAAGAWIRRLRRVLDALFPDSIYCLCCGSVIDSSRAYSLCDHCIDKVGWVTEDARTCTRCGKLLGENYLYADCRDCRDVGRAFDRGWTCAGYGLYARALIMDFKYRDRSYIGRHLGTAMADRFAAAGVVPDLATVVPVHADRLEERGYNQAELLARCVAARLRVPLEASLLRRRRETAPMKDLDRWQRRLNVRRAFALAPGRAKDVADRHLLLIDDIFTTGATLDACSRVLKDAGAARVDVLTFAAGGNLPSERDTSRTPLRAHICL